MALTDSSDLSLWQVGEEWEEGEGEEGTITTTMPGTGTDTQWLQEKTTNTTTYTITMKMTAVTIMTRMPFDPDGMDLFNRPYL